MKYVLSAEAITQFAITSAENFYERIAVSFWTTSSSTRVPNGGHSTSNRVRNVHVPVPR